VAGIKTNQKQVKDDCELQLRSIADSFPPLSGAVDKINAETASITERYRETLEERKKLHNLVLELKGNIRVFARVRPINEREKNQENAKESTITFAEDMKISVFEETFTMSGNAENPGLNKRVLTELFRIREERKVDTKITISMMVTEIYNEQIKDLLGTEKSKKVLDVKQNPDGSNTVPGLTEVTVNSVEDVLTCMEQAQSNPQSWRRT